MSPELNFRHLSGAFVGAGRVSACSSKLLALPASFAAGTMSIRMSTLLTRDPCSHEGNLLAQIPLGWGQILKTSANWGFHTTYVEGQTFDDVS